LLSPRALLSLHLFSSSWITWFLSTKGNEYFVEIDEDYILDRFNLTGLNGEVVQEYARALDLITDQLGMQNLDIQGNHATGQCSIR